MNQTYSQGSGSGGNVNSYNVNCYNNIIHNTIADDKPQILQWLSPLEPQKRHQQICDNWHDGVGEWIFDRDEIVKWRTEEDGSHPVIFCEGNPGIGKTHLSSLVMDRLQDEAVRSRRNVKVIGLYCDYLDRKEQTVWNLLGALLKQVVCIGDIPEDIRQVFKAAKGYLGGAGVQVISVSPTADDIKRYLTMKLDKDTVHNAMDDRLREDILRIIPQKISEIFLPASLTIETILGETTISKRRKRLDEMTKRQNVGDVYTATLERIKAQMGSKSRLAMDALMWISHSECPLGPDELFDSLSTTVRLVHFTLQEYLHANPTLFHSPHSMIAERTHARMETIESIIPLALKLLNEFGEHISSKLLILHTEFVYTDFPNRLFDEEGSPKGFTGLHGAYYFGVKEIMLALLQFKKWDINATDQSGNTALGWAVAEGHNGVVKMLLERNDLDPNIANLEHQTPLLRAARQRYEPGVKMLLERSDFNPNTADTSGRTPLSWAAEYGWEGVVMMLLNQSDVNPDMADKSGQTPHLWAVGGGRMKL
ncbi:ankyrin [Choiromyces venosus 120613-1]|uniref:Ankyrin n=1 Tax=Choiromyces venosus 120613-1 TaxID=1336337 RepID=A0A3N4IWF1_9PEZI|nr:ankyrin [Choiromyces venosus 120613-1]